MGALPKALARRGHRVMVVAPRYANYEEAWDTSVRITVNAAGSHVEVGVLEEVSRIMREIGEILANSSLHEGVPSRQAGVPHVSTGHALRQPPAV